MRAFSLTWVGDLVGLAVLAVFVFCAAALVSRPEEHSLFWGGGYALLALSGLYLWRNKSAPTDVKSWLKFSAGILLVDFASLCLDVVLGQVFTPGASFLQGAMHVGTPFGFVLTAVIIPGLLIVAVAGTIRVIFLGWLGGA